MTIAVWSSRFATGIPSIDAQHQDLFAAVNDLGESFAAGRAHDQVKDCLRFLMNYTEEHFRDEEQLMRGMDYPGLSSHREEHTQLTENLNQLQARLEMGKTITMDVTILLADWLTHHISTVDMRYVDFLRERQLE